MNEYIPVDVPPEARTEFRKNFVRITQGTGNLFLFSADHKIEHLDRDFIGPNIPHEVHTPHHIFNLATHGAIGALATQLGLIARYGATYSTIPYIIKLNSKTSGITDQNHDPMSRLLWTVNDVVTFKRSSNLTICGVGITIYLGSTYENLMLEQAAQTIFQAHQQGLIAIVWMYPRGSGVLDERDPQLLAGAAGVAACLGADFVKIHAPNLQDKAERAEALKIIVEAAGTTQVLLAGGAFKESEELLAGIKEDMAYSGIAGFALGRSIFQHSLSDALSVCKAISTCIYEK